MSPRTKEFWSWVKSQYGEWGRFSMDADGNFYLKNRQASLVIAFYRDDIVEMMIFVKDKEDPSHYLHFQLDEMEHAKTLFGSMIEIFEAIKPENTIRILLCCTSGCTSGLFACQLNEAADLLRLQYSFDASACWRLYDAARECDAILLAPQVSYLQKKFQKALPDIPVWQIPAGLFSGSDTYKTLQFLDEQFASRENESSRDFFTDWLSGCCLYRLRHDKPSGQSFQ